MIVLSVFFSQQFSVADVIPSSGTQWISGYSEPFSSIMHILVPWSHTNEMGAGDKLIETQEP